MEVSVIVPVFNAVEFVRQAVESALAQPETGEVILVDDGSSDGSLQVCQQLAVEHSNVHLYRHADGKNHGVSTSRNLGIQKSRCEYVAFLDADDHFLPNRFVTARRLFDSDTSIDGVYEAIGVYYVSDLGHQRWIAAGRREIMNTMTERVTPERLFEALIRGGKGDFSIIGMVVKKSIFDKAGHFPEHLHVYEDTLLQVKMAAVAKLVPGQLEEPVALRSIHDHNTISAPRPPSLKYKLQMMYWKTLWDWSKDNLSRDQQQLVLERMISMAKKRYRFNYSILNSRVLSRFRRLFQLLLLPASYPQLLREEAFWRAFLQG